MISTKELLLKGIAAAKAKQVGEALAFLRQVVEVDPYNQMAWLWLSEVVETDEQRVICLENVLALNPDNKAAQEGLALLKRRVAAEETLSEGVERSAPLMTTASAPSSEPADSLAVKPREPTAAPRSQPAERRSYANAIGCIGTVGALVLVGIVLAALIGALDTSTRATPESGPHTYHPGLGEDGFLRSRGGGPLPVAVDEEAWQAMSDAVVAGDDYGMAELVATGRVLAVDSGTRVRVIDRALYRTKIRVLEGKHTGRGGWVAYEFVIAYSD
jgi:hypothetical protein